MLNRAMQGGHSKLVLAGLLAVALMLCRCAPPEEKAGGIFSDLRPHPELNDVLTLKETRPGEYDFSFTFWKQTLRNGEYVPEFAVSGTLTAVSNCLRLQSDRYADHFVLFDYGLGDGSSRRISVLEKQMYGDKIITERTDYLLAQDTSFYDAALVDSIFKFRMARVLQNESDLVFFVGKRTGPQGIYHGRLFMNEKAEAEEDIYSWRGNIYEKRIPLKKADTKETRSLDQKF